jgi:hypothetical protein
MAAGQAAVSFDEIIQAGKPHRLWRNIFPNLTFLTDRKRRQNVALAEEIFGKARKNTSRPATRGRGNGGTLASRIGVSKVRALSCHSYDSRFTVQLFVSSTLSFRFSANIHTSNPRTKPANPPTHSKPPTTTPSPTRRIPAIAHTPLNAQYPPLVSNA